MAKVAVFARLVARPGRRDDLVQMCQQLLNGARGEDGTELYVLHVSDQEPDVVRLYELYRDDEALAAHGGSDTMTSVFPRLSELLAAAPDMAVSTPVAAKGIDAS